MADRIATREAYGAALADLGERNKDIVVLDADLSKSTKTDVFRKKFPDRFFNIGIAEADMIGTAAGLAACGKIAFASSFAVFAAGRAFDQVRNTVAYGGLNVKIGATHAGITVGEDGASHQAIEDISLMRAIPGMTVINPADAVETRAAVEAAVNHDGPVYLRLGRLSVPLIFDEKTYRFELGKGVLIEDGTDAAIIATGYMVHEAIEARKMLLAEGIRVRLIDIHTIKPIDMEIIVKAARETGAIVTAEEHNIMGGLGSAVAEILVENHPVPMKRVGLKDCFGRSGKPAALIEAYEMSGKHIAAAVKEVMKMKRA